MSISASSGSMSIPESVSSFSFDWVCSAPRLSSFFMIGYYLAMTGYLDLNLNLGLALVAH